MNLLKAAVWLVFSFLETFWYFRYRALRDLSLPLPDALHIQKQRRFKHYFYGTTFLSALFCALRGYGRTRRERYLYANLSALAYYFDDLVDAMETPAKSTILWQDNPEAYGRTNDAGGLALHLLHNVYQALPARDLADFKADLHCVFNLETAGKQQQSHALTTAQLLNITAEKGGRSVLLFRRALANPLNETEQQALHNFGCLIQFCDDIFDIWFDRQAGIQTVPLQKVSGNEMDELIQLFENQVTVTKSSFKKIAQIRSKKQSETAPKKAFGLFKSPGEALGLVHFLVTVTRVCLFRYKKLQKKHGTLPLDNRAEMVVDMERWSNRIRAACYLFLKPL